MSIPQEPTSKNATGPAPVAGWQTGDVDLSAFSATPGLTEAKTVEFSFWATVPTGQPIYQGGVWVNWILTITGYAAAAVMLPVWVATIVSLVTRKVYPSDRFVAAPLTALLIIGLLFWLFVATAIWGTFRLRRSGNRGYLWWRLLRFAQANGLTYRPWAAVDGSTTSLLRGNDKFWFEDCFQPEIAPLDLTVATLVIGGDATEFNLGVRKWGFIEFRLDRSMPHIVVETTERGRATDDYGMLASEGFELEGDFPSYNRVYAAEGDRATALELLTPDVMAAIVDETAGFDLEVRGDRLSLTSPVLSELAYPTTLARLFHIAAVIGTEARALSARRGDARFAVEPAPAATPTRMRQRRIPRGAVRGFVISAIAIGVPTVVAFVSYIVRAT